MVVDELFSVSAGPVDTHGTLAGRPELAADVLAAETTLKALR